MKSFKLYVYKSEFYRILITEHDHAHPTGSPSLYSTFDEQLSCAENDQLTLTFSLMKYVDGRSYNVSQAQEKPTYKLRTENQYHRLLQMGTRLELVLDSKDKYIFIIKNIKPIVSKSNVKYEYTCQDEVSYTWSRRKLGMSYSTLEFGTTQDIYTIAANVLQRAGLTEWRAHPVLDSDTDIDTLSSKHVTLEVENSNPYNILIEACNTLNAYMKVNYTHKYVSFYQKDRIKFSGYRYRPNVNLRSLDVDYDMDEYSSLMHVYGGTDANGRIVNLFPELPYNMRQWWLKHDEDPPLTLPWSQINSISLRPYKSNCKIDMSGKVVYSERNYEVVTEPIKLDQVSILYGRLKISNNDGSDSNYWPGIRIAFYLTEEDALKKQNPINNTRYGFSAQQNGTYNKTIDIPSGATYMRVNYYKSTNIETSLTYDSEFSIMAKKLPHLGNFLYDFDFFLRNGSMSQDEYDKIQSIFNYDMRNVNMWLKCYEPAYYRAYSELYVKLQEMKTLLENLVINGITEEALSSTAEYKGLYNDIVELIKKMYYGKSVQLIDFWTDISDANKVAFSVDILQDIVNFYIYTVNEMQIAAPYANMSDNEDDPNISYYKKRYKTLLPLVGDGYGALNYTGDDGVSYRTAYGTLVKILFNAINNSDNKQALYEQLIKYQEQSNAIWNNLYFNYGQYLYEAKYENSTELDSLNLFNQATIYFENCKRPNGNYSIKTIDIGALELIGVPRLSVGSKIRVYNEELNLNEPASDNSDDINTALNNMQFTNNELIVTSLNYKLRTPGDVSIEVEQVSSYKSILQRLIQMVN